jgi:hypothetical protein
MPSISFRRFLSGSLALAFVIHTCHAHGATFPTTLTTTALDRSSSGWFAAFRLHSDRGGPPDQQARLPHLPHSTASSGLIFYIQPPSTFVFTPLRGKRTQDCRFDRAAALTHRCCLLSQRRRTRPDRLRPGSRATATAAVPGRCGSFAVSLTPLLLDRFDSFRPLRLYEAMDDEVGRTAPPGCIVHTASEVDGKVRVVNVWESQQHIDEFFQSKLGPAFEKLAIEMDPPELTETFWIAGLSAAPPGRNRTDGRVAP